MKEKVILFGRGMVYQRKKASLYSRYEVCVILDNAVNPGESVYLDQESGEGIPVNAEGCRQAETKVAVVNPAEIVRYHDMPVILLSYALGDMYRQLRE